MLIGDLLLEDTVIVVQHVKNNVHKAESSNFSADCSSDHLRTTDDFERLRQNVVSSYSSREDELDICNSENNDVLPNVCSFNYVKEPGLLCSLSTNVIQMKVEAEDVDSEPDDSDIVSFEDNTPFHAARNAPILSESAVDENMTPDAILEEQGTQSSKVDSSLKEIECRLNEIMKKQQN